MLSERIDTELKVAARAQDKQRLGTLRMFKSAIKYREIETGSPLTDAEVMAVCATLIKQRKDSASQYAAAGRGELADTENAEIRILESFLPQQLTDAELSGLVREGIAATAAKGPRDMGAVMKHVQAQAAGRAEGKRISEAVKQALSSLAGS